jgi:uncharacterized protein (DUF433 family)
VVDGRLAGGKVREGDWIPLQGRCGSGVDWAGMVPKLSHEDHLNLPAYSVSEAAGYVDVPVNTLQAWVRGTSHGAARRRSQPIIKAGARGLSFINLVEAHALAAIRRVYKVALQKVRKALRDLPQIFGEDAKDHPLARYEFFSDGLDLFIEKLDSYVSISGGLQTELKDVLSTFLQRVVYDKHRHAIRLYPTLKAEGRADDPRFIMIDPFVAFGKPVLAEIGVSTFIVADRFEANDDPQDLAEEYGCDIAQIYAAIRWELRNPDPRRAA